MEHQTVNARPLKDKLDELKWLKVYALIGVGRRDEALGLLSELANSDGAYQKSADSLYDVLTTIR